jgi:hypothetical protein
MSSIKQLIINAVIKVSGENPSFNGPDHPSAEEARDSFIALLIAELFPGDSSVPTKPKKVKKTKAEPITVVIEKTEPVAAEKSEPVAAEKSEDSAAAESPKRKRAPMTEEAKLAAKIKRDAKKAAGQPVSPLQSGPVLEAPSPVVAAAPRVKKTQELNLKKIDATWRKHLKTADKQYVKEREPELLAYLNGLSAETFNSKKAEEHAAEFVAGRLPKPAADGKVDADLVEVDFNGKTYYVNAETDRIYEGEGEFSEEVGWTNYKGVGYVGMAAFSEMTLDE